MQSFLAKQYNQDDTRIPGIVQTIAENSFTITIPQIVLEKWGILARGCGSADDEVDKLPTAIQRQQMVQAGLDYMSGKRDTLPSSNQDFLSKIAQLKTAVETLPLQEKSRFLHNIALICRITEKMRNETNIRKASILRRIEGQTLARLYETFIPKDIRYHPNYKVFRRTLQKLFRAGNNIDMVFDLPDDFHCGRTLIHPTFINRFIFFKDSIREAFSALRGVNISFLARVLLFEIREFSRRKPL